jgi:hypothetical protein
VPRPPVGPSARLPDFSAGCPTLRFGLCSGPFSEHEMLTGTQMVRLGRQDLDVWLGEPDDFVLAVLRDIYSEEFDVQTMAEHASRRARRESGYRPALGWPCC